MVKYRTLAWVFAALALVLLVDASLVGGVSGGGGTTTTATGAGTSLMIALTASGTSSAPGGSFTFAATASGGAPPYMFSWNFGDGATGSGQTVSHVYASTGNFVLTATVTDSQSKTAAAQLTISVEPCPTGYTNVGGTCVKPQAFTLSVTAASSSGVPLSAPVTINGNPAGTTPTSTVESPGQYLVACGTVPGYVAPVPQSVYVLSSDVAVSCVYAPAGVQTSQVTVTVTLNGQGYAGVPVKIVGTGYSASTNTLGQVTFTLASGTYTASASTAYGIVSQSFTVSAPTAASVSLSYSSHGLSVLGGYFGGALNEGIVGVLALAFAAFLFTRKK